MKGLKNKKKEYCTNLRLPNKLADKVKKLAKENKRSINSEIEYALTEYIQEVTPYI